ncbi:glycosyltransferase [Xenorhabdus ishibashii]|uniref:Uncharacterized protein n=1 Tax=Xenorhabdus ishibashii TaxID=1034471 RepID=A0A2D0KA87_9GAMM|nr:glycosyltransferase [Xenorhabdus ishibashii]PHM60374.1 hypothetical protein Xish_03521 [Xenorhabdus ishibashii]
MNIPKKIHYFWTGDKIPESNLRNIIAIKYENPGYIVNIWGENKDKSLILKTLNSLKFRAEKGNFDIGDLSTNLIYKNIDTAFNILYENVDPDCSHKHSGCFKKTNNNSIKLSEKNKKRFGDPLELMRYLHHVYKLQLHGVYYNYASASDIARLVILYTEGGIYLDTDVKLTNSQIINYIDDDHTINSTEKNDAIKNKSRFDKIVIHSDIGFGDVSGKGWKKINSDTITTIFGNAIISSPIQSKKVLDILFHISMSLKRRHLAIQINQLDKSHKINKIIMLEKEFEIDRKIDNALKYHKRNEIKMDMRCSILDPIWRTGFVDDKTKSFHNRHRNENIALKCAERRVRHTKQLTGPGIYSNFFNFKGKVPKKYRIENSDEYDLFFDEVDAKSPWAIINIKKRKSI